jgi:hypothetical protein
MGVATVYFKFNFIDFDKDVFETPVELVQFTDEDNMHSNETKRSRVALRERLDNYTNFALRNNV